MHDQVAAADTNDDDEEPLAMEAGDNEILFSTYDLDPKQLQQLYAELIRVLRRYDCGEIVINCSDSE